MNSSCRVDETVSKIVTFDMNAVRRFAALAGGMNPLHHDEALAETARERRAALGLGLEFEFSFRKALAAGDTVTMTWRSLRSSRARS